MGDLELWKLILGFLGTALGAFLLYLGATRTSGAAKEGVNRTAKVDEQQSALDAWKELLEPYRGRIEELGRETDRLRDDLRKERDDRAAREEADEKARVQAKHEVQSQMDGLTERIDLLTLQVTEWKRLAKTIARWASRLRDEVLRLGGTVPATPEELLTLQAIEDAENDARPTTERNP